VPAAVFVAPDRIGVVEDVHGEPHPVVGALDFIQEGDAHLAQEMPGPVAVAGVRLPQVARPEMGKHLLAADFHDPTALRALRVIQEVADKRVGAGEAAVVRHAGLVVVAIACGAVGSHRAHSWRIRLPVRRIPACLPANA